MNEIFNERSDARERERERERELETKKTVNMTEIFLSNGRHQWRQEAKTVRNHAKVEKFHKIFFTNPGFKYVPCKDCTFCSR